MGHDDPLADSLQLDLAMKGLKRIKPYMYRRPQTTWFPESMFEVLSHDAQLSNKFFGFLRSGEFTVSSLEVFDHRWHFTPMDDHNNLQVIHESQAEVFKN